MQPNISQQGSDCTEPLTGVKGAPFSMTTSWRMQQRTKLEWFRGRPCQSPHLNHWGTFVERPEGGSSQSIESESALEDWSGRNCPNAQAMLSSPIHIQLALSCLLAWVYIIFGHNGEILLNWKSPLGDCEHLTLPFLHSCDFLCTNLWK